MSSTATSQDHASFSARKSLNTIIIKGVTMQRRSLSAVVAGMLLVGQSVFALESDELMERARDIRKKAAATTEQAKQASARMLEAAERLEHQAKGGGEPGEFSGLEMKTRQLKERIEDLTVKERKLREANAPEQQLADVRAEISEIEQNLRAMHAKHSDQANQREYLGTQWKFRQLEAASRRVHHIRVAAENLKQAEMHDVAHQLVETAEKMEQDVKRAKQRLEKEMDHPNEQPREHGAERMQELQNENERLKQMIKELTRKIENR
jgi:DNA repair exonuclease SbcCD ATPase subunit